VSFAKILIIVFVLIYILSPVDGLPDFIPILGWIDDAFLLGILLYYLKRGRLPGFLSWLERFTAAGQNRPNFQQKQKSTPRAAADSETRDPHEVLGIRPGAGPEEIRSAYRKVIQAYHPDKVSHLGPEFRELAQEKFVEIQNAYEKLSKENKSGLF